MDKKSKNVIVYKLLKEMPGHIPGDLIYLNELNYFVFENEPKYKLDPEQIKKHPDWFEKVIIGWKRGQQIYFLDVLGNIIEDEFNPERHSSLIFKKRAFNNKENAKIFSEKINSFINGKSVVLTKEEIKDMISKKDIKEIKNVLNKYI